MLNVNTIEFNDRKAVINSYSDHPIMVEDCERQRASWAQRFPKATVKTERLSETDTGALVGDPDKNRHAAWDIGKASRVTGSAA